MSFRKSRRSGRQIPEGLLILFVGSLSLTFGVPIARILQSHFPQFDRWIWFIAGISAGFLILLAIYHALEWISGWLMRKR